jgi:hypothetical protein
MHNSHVREWWGGENFWIEMFHLLRENINLWKLFYIIILMWIHNFQSWWWAAFPTRKICCYCCSQNNNSQLINDSEIYPWEIWDSLCLCSIKSHIIIISIINCSLPLTSHLGIELKFKFATSQQCFNTHTWFKNHKSKVR